MNYTDFRVSASEIGSLLGVFGGNKQFNTLCKVWEKSTYKATYKDIKQGQQSGSMYWQDENQHIRLLGVSDTWKQICASTSLCSTQEDIHRIHGATLQLLFQNDFVKNTMAQMHHKLHNCSHLSSEESKVLQQLLVNICHSQDVSYDCLQMLKKKRVELGLDSLHSTIEMLEMSSKLCYSVQQRCTRAYGVNGECKYIAQFGTVWEDSQFKQENKLHSRTVTGEKVDNSTWCIDGRIDGLKDGEICEIKHRKRCYMNTLPVYELIQLHAYMFLLQKQRALLVQCIRRSDYVGSHENTVYFSGEFWCAVISQVKKALKFIKNLHSEPLARDCFFALDDADRHKVMEKYIGPKPSLSTHAYNEMLRI